jgi:hypothetical protein
MHPSDVAMAAEALRAVLAAVDSGEMHATREQAAYLTGAAETLERLTISMQGTISRRDDQ